MARGFESKDVEFQQEEAQRRQQPPRGVATPEQRASAERRRTVELALARARGDLVAARSQAHRQMLEQAIAALEEQLQSEPR